MTSCDWTMKIFAGKMIAKYQVVGGHDVLHGFDFLRAFFIRLST